MHIEYECTMLEVNVEDLESRLKLIGATKVGSYFQQRNTYDFNPKIENKWIRLRTNGEITTLTIKNVVDKNLIGGTQELEIEVSNFENTNLILEELGYIHKNYQENKRTLYKLNDVEIAIDSWPLIPAYAEIEGRSEEDVEKIINLLDLKYKITNLDVTSIYKDIYGIDVLKIKDLIFKD